MKCLICDKPVTSTRGLSRHIKNHNTTPEEYTLKYFYGGVSPTCECGCGGKTKYITKKYSFNKYLHNHHKPTLGTKMSQETKDKIAEKQKRHQSQIPKEKREKKLEKARAFRKAKNDVEQDVKPKHIVEFGTSGDFEKQVVSFVRKVSPSSVLQDVSSIIYPYKLDIYIPSMKFAIELIDLYQHSDLYKSKTYHYDKFLACQNAGITLLQFFEDEWRDKPHICRSIIKQKLGLTSHKYDARKLIVSDSKVGLKDFVDANHLQGYCRCVKAFTLRDADGSILFCVTLRKPFTKNKNDSIEIGRICSKQDCSVRGGYSRLMKHALEWSKSAGYVKLLTYSDCRYSSGDTYKNFGFDFVGHTNVGYDYTDFEVRYNRFKFRARPGKPEKIVAEENDVYKIFNTGNYRWEMAL